MSFFCWSKLHGDNYSKIKEPQRINSEARKISTHMRSYRLKIFEVKCEMFGIHSVQLFNLF